LVGKGGGLELLEDRVTGGAFGFHSLANEPY
jgi:hypothetical protein